MVATGIQRSEMHFFRGMPAMRMLHAVAVENPPFKCIIASQGIYSANLRNGQFFNLPVLWASLYASARMVLACEDYRR